MDSSGEYTLPVDIIRNEEKIEGYTSGSTNIEYNPYKLQQRFLLMSAETLPPKQAEKLAKNTTLYFDLLSYYKHVFKYSPLAKEALKMKNVTQLLAWSEIKKSFITLADIAHATELVFPHDDQPAIMINLRKIEKELDTFVTRESKEAALKAVLGEYWQKGCQQIIDLQNPQRKIMDGIQKVAKKAGIGTGVGMLNFAATFLPLHGVPFPYSVAIGPAVNVAFNMLQRKKTQPESNPDSQLFDVHYEPKMTSYSPLPPFLYLPEL